MALGPSISPPVVSIAALTSSQGRKRGSLPAFDPTRTASVFPVGADRQPGPQGSCRALVAPLVNAPRRGWSVTRAGSLGGGGGTCHHGRAARWYGACPMP